MKTVLQSDAKTAASDGQTKKRTGNRNSPAAKQMRVYRERLKDAESIPPAPEPLTLEMLRAQVQQTEDQLNQAITWTTIRGIGAQEAADLSYAAKGCIKLRAALKTMEEKKSPPITCSCATCAPALDTAMNDDLFRKYKANAWRAAHLARLALPTQQAEGPEDRSSHRNAKSWVFTFDNSIDSLQASIEAIDSRDDYADPSFIVMSKHRHEFGPLMEKLAVADAVLAEKQERLTSLLPASPALAAPTRFLSTAELADLGV